MARFKVGDIIAAHGDKIVRKILKGGDVHVYNTESSTGKQEMSRTYIDAHYKLVTKTKKDTKIARLMYKNDIISANDGKLIVRETSL